MKTWPSCHEGDFSFWNRFAAIRQSWQSAWFIRWLTWKDGLCKGLLLPLPLLGEWKSLRTSSVGETSQPSLLGAKPPPTWARASTKVLQDWSLHWGEVTQILVREQAIYDLDSQADFQKFWRCNCSQYGWSEIKAYVSHQGYFACFLPGGSETQDDGNFLWVGFEQGRGGLPLSYSQGQATSASCQDCMASSITLTREL